MDLVHLGFVGGGAYEEHGFLLVRHLPHDQLLQRDHRRLVVLRTKSNNKNNSHHFSLRGRKKKKKKCRFRCGKTQTHLGSLCSSNLLTWDQTIKRMIHKLRHKTITTIVETALSLTRGLTSWGQKDVEPECLQTEKAAVTHHSGEDKSLVLLLEQ